LLHYNNAGKKYVSNPFLRLLEPAVGQRYQVRAQSKQWHEDVVEVSLFDQGQAGGNGGSTALVAAPLKHKPVLRIKRADDQRGFLVTIYHPIPVSSSPASSLRWEMIPLTLRYRYLPHSNGISLYFFYICNIWNIRVYIEYLIAYILLLGTTPTERRRPSLR
jgi:hypothetical protein